jgi:glyoxylase-like metal-dependent hydrolase (beta-lactamase superfamily II)
VKIGAFDLDVLVDGEGSFATVGQAFPSVDSDEEWRLRVNVAVVRGGGSTVLVDTGLGPLPRAFMPDAGALLLDGLARLSVAPEDVDLVVHTHLHVDHVGWDGAFPSARYVVHQADLDFFLADESLAERPHLREKVVPLFAAGRIDPVRAETELTAGVRVVPTPGHTPGHVSLLLESEGQTAAVLGDAVVHELQLAAPGLAYFSDEDAGRAAATRARLLEQLAETEPVVAAGHLAGLGRIVRRGEEFGWAPLGAAGSQEDALPVE